jgi:hypothetical protein
MDHDDSIKEIFNISFHSLLMVIFLGQREEGTRSVQYSIAQEDRGKRELDLCECKHITSGFECLGGVHSLNLSEFAQLRDET